MYNTKLLFLVISVRADYLVCFNLIGLSLSETLEWAPSLLLLSQLVTASYICDTPEKVP